jgi:hypothetical protein
MPLAHQLPGNDVRVVLHAGDQDFIAFLQQQLPKAVRRQVDARRSATGEDDLVRMLRVDVLRIVSRAASCASVALVLSVCTPRCTLALIVA